ncbi:hypothetical protein LWI29_020328 [Acer saccharum]|uniref:NAC domain-containing protein n=1 Tax=Acer saccharum TaxID=4024 RepID=A0AA39RZC3_ACESA|nr:hypothetical protein LWI29_020328 [Acer saccharum]
MLVKNRKEFPRQYLCRQLKKCRLDSLAVEQHSKRVNDRLNSIAVEQHSKMVNGRLDSITTEDNSVTALQSKLRKIFELQEVERRLISLGYIFSPEEGLLIHHYLREKYVNELASFHCIFEVDVYRMHPQYLTENYSAAGNVWYFLTCAGSNETRPGTDVLYVSENYSAAGRWIFEMEMDVFYRGEKTGIKQLLQYCELDRKTEYKMIEYKLDPLEARKLMV